MTVARRNFLMSRKQTFNSMNFKIPFNKPIVEKFHPMGKKGKFF